MASKHFRIIQMQLQTGVEGIDRGIELIKEGQTETAISVLVNAAGKVVLGQNHLVQWRDEQVAQWELVLPHDDNEKDWRKQ